MHLKCLEHGMYYGHVSLPHWICSSGEQGVCLIRLFDNQCLAQSSTLARYASARMIWEDKKGSLRRHNGDYGT